MKEKMNKKAKEIFVRLGGEDLVITKEDFENDNYSKTLNIDTDCTYYFIGYEDVNGKECEEDGTYLNQNKRS